MGYSRTVLKHHLGDLDELDDPGSVVCGAYRHRNRECACRSHTLMLGFERNY